MLCLISQDRVWSFWQFLEVFEFLEMWLKAVVDEMTAWSVL